MTSKAYKPPHGGLPKKDRVRSLKLKKDWKTETEPKQETEERVITKIRARREMGYRKYGTTMEREDLSRLDWLIHAQEEAMDLAIYLERLISEENE